MSSSKILVVDDNHGMVQLICHFLAGLGELHFANNGTSALKMIRAAPPDLVLLDAEMPGLSGFDVCEALKADSVLKDIPVIFVTGHSDLDFELKSLEVGAVDFITKPINGQLLAARVKTQLRLKQLTDELKQASTIDPATGAVNRRSFNEALMREWRRGARMGAPFCLLIIEPDHFGLYQERYGPQAGDACLRSVAQALRSACLRPGDVVARCEGNRFALLLPQTPRTGAEHVAHRMLNAIEALAMPHENSPTSGHVTVSIGIGCYDDTSPCWATLPTGGTSAPAMTCKPAELVTAAELALQGAQQGGRAQAWQLDIADVQDPSQAREIEPWGHVGMKADAPG